MKNKQNSFGPPPRVRSDEELLCALRQKLTEAAILEDIYTHAALIKAVEKILLDAKREEIFRKTL